MYELGKTGTSLWAQDASAVRWPTPIEAAHMAADRLLSALKDLGVPDIAAAGLLQQAQRAAGGSGGALTNPSRICPHCDGPMRLQEREAVNASVLCVGGWEVRRHVPLRCEKRGCLRKRVWYNYISESTSNHVWHWRDHDRLEYLFLANTWGVSAQWLRQFTQRLAHQHASFDSEAKVHGEAARRAGRAEVVPFRADLKLQKAWIAWRVIVRLFEHANGQRGLNLLKTSPDMLKSIWSWYPDHMFYRRVQRFTEKGNSIKTVVIDGNAKLARRICGRAVAELMHCAPLDRYTATQCPCKPQFKMKCCGKHMASVLSGDCGPPQSEVIVAHRRRRVLETAPKTEPYDVCLVVRGQEDNPGALKRWAAACHVTQGQLQEYWSKAENQAYVPAASPDADLHSVSCRTHKETQPRRASSSSNPSKFSRRCGWLYACTPDGYIVHLKEYVGAESLPQRYFFLAEVVEKAPAVDVVRHDDACHLRRYASKREGDSAFARRLSFPNIKYITDGLHDKNHVDPWCLANCSPKAEPNKALVQGVNSQICEQLFSSLGRHKYSVRRMGQFTSAFLLTELAEVRNDAWLAKQERARAGAGPPEGE